MKRYHYQFVWGGYSSGFRYADAPNEIEAIEILKAEFIERYGHQNNRFKLKI